MRTTPCSISQNVKSKPCGRPFHQAAIPFDEQVYRDYSEINLSLWKQLERNEISREALKTRRFEMLGRRHPLGCIPEALNGFYAQAPFEQTFLIDGAKAFLEQAARAARLYIVTNGIASTQQRRFAAAAYCPISAACLSLNKSARPSRKRLSLTLFLRRFPVLTKSGR